MDEAKARDICLAEGDKLLVYSRDELAAADRWVKRHATGKLKQYLSKTVSSGLIRDYVWMMVQHTYGTAETDKFLKDLNCYPDWLQ